MKVNLLRPRRLRKNEAIRSMVRENTVSIKDFIYPIFVVPGRKVKEEISSLPGCYHFSVDEALKEVERAAKVGIPAVEIFGLPEYKDDIGSSAWDMTSPVQQAMKAIKKEFPHMLIVGDVCLCQYTNSGHCGKLCGQEVDNDPTLELLAKTAVSQAEAGADIIAPSDMMDGRIAAIREALDKEKYTNSGHCGKLCGQEVDNDPTLELLAKTAVSQAEAGADIIAPSDMMDGRIAAIREALDKEKYENTSIMSYAVKYASAYYGPFRDAANSAPQFGNRKGYQMDPANSREAMKEVELDLAEGADIIMVKPALAYLDIVHQVREKINRPVAVYNVSGEYAMVKAAAANGWIDEKRIVMESMMCMKRAGADIIISYHAIDVAKWLKEEENNV